MISQLFLFSDDWNSPDYYKGNEYYICDEPINVRDSEGFNGKVIDKLYIGEKIKVLDFGKYEKIDGNYNFFWTKIEYQNGKTGWIYGKYIAVKTIIKDLDNNGIDDYIFLRERHSGFFHDIEYPEDILVYLNGKLLTLPKLYKDNFSHVHFYTSNDKILFTVEDEYEFAPLPGEDDYSKQTKRRLFILVFSKDGVKLVKEINDLNCNKLDSHSINHGELKDFYIEPYLGKDYIFCN